MKFKKEYIILFFVIIVLAVYLAKRTKDRTLYEIPEIPEIVLKDISKIEIAKSDITLVLHKEDKKWFVGLEKYKADEDEVKDILDIIENLTLTAMVSESKAFNRYDLSDDKKIMVKAWDGNTLKREFEIGKTALSRKHTFIKLPDDDRVFHASKNFRGDFDQTEDNFRDKEVLTFEEGEIHEVRIIKGEQKVVFIRNEKPIEVRINKEDEDEEAAVSPSKTETVWKTADGKIGKKEDIEILIYRLEGLRCEGYIYDRKKEEFTNPIYTIELKGSKEHTLTIFDKINKDDENYPAVSDENDSPFILPEWRMENIKKDPDELLEKPQETSLPGQAK